MIQGVYTLDITRSQLMVSMLVALALHVLVFLVYAMLPHDPLETMKVTTLQVQLGSAKELFKKGEEAKKKQVDVNAANLKKSLAAQAQQQGAMQMQQPQEKQQTKEEVDEEALREAYDKSVSEPKEKKEPLMAEEYLSAEESHSKNVRESSHPESIQLVEQEGSPIGQEDAHTQEVVKRYTQIISMWVNRHYNYPSEARNLGMQGVAVVRLRIDRYGNITFFKLDKQTGHRALDKAALEMVERANPVPPVPDDYPSDQLIEFLIPVKFTL